tara:strand:+ start:7077 stop:8333 length:1257 start_codon:yes stop_codon:yes gene_type:complete
MDSFVSLLLIFIRIQERMFFFPGSTTKVMREFVSLLALICGLVVITLTRRDVKNWVLNTDEMSRLLLSSNRLDLDNIGVRKSTGLGKDFDVFAHILGVQTVKSGRNASHLITQGNMVLMLEHLTSTRPGQRVVFVPNQELINDKDEQVLLKDPAIMCVLCKSHYAFSIFENFRMKHKCKWYVERFVFPPIVYKPYVSEPKDRKIVLHPAGKSWMKHTSVVLRAWQNNPDWPTLIVSCAHSCATRHSATLKAAKADNIHIHSFLSKDDITRLQKHAGYVILPSACEGFGHSIYEACANGNLLISSNIPPINERLQDGRNCILINPNKRSPLGHKDGFKWTQPLSKAFGEAGSACFYISVEETEKAVEHAIRMNNEEYSRIRHQAFEDWKEHVGTGLVSTESALVRTGFNSILTKCHHSG